MNYNEFNHFNGTVKGITMHDTLNTSPMSKTFIARGRPCMTATIDRALLSNSQLDIDIITAIVLDEFPDRDIKTTRKYVSQHITSRARAQGLIG